MTPVRRELLGRSFSSGYERNFVYLFDQGLEIDVVEGYQIQRVRVFFEDVRMLTLHNRRPPVLPWLSGLLAAFVGLVCLAMLSAMNTGNLAEQWGRVLGSLILFTPCLALFLATLRSRRYLTVHGNRSKATMQWTWRRSRAEQVYLRLNPLIEAVQQAKRERLAQQQRDAPSAFAPPPNDMPPAGPATAAGSLPSGLTPALTAGAAPQVDGPPATSDASTGPAGGPPVVSG